MNDTNDWTVLDENKLDNAINKGVRLKPEEMDERYISAYLRHPEAGKITALSAAGHPHPSSQRAWQIHKRLSDRIDKQLDELILHDAALGRGVLVELAKHSTSDAVRASSASKLMEYAGKQRPERLIVENRSMEDIDAEIAATQRRILIAQGEEIPDDEMH